MVVNGVDYGPAPAEMVATIENMRSKIDVDRRLIMIKFLARTIEADGDATQQHLGALIDGIVTGFFNKRYSRDES